MPQVSAPCVECGTEIRRRPGARGALPERCRDCYPKDRARRRDKRAVRYHRDPLYREKMLAKARRNRKPYRYLPAKPCRTPGCDQLARSAKHWYCEPHGLAAQAASSNGWRRRAPQKGSTRRGDTAGNTSRGGLGGSRGSKREASPAATADSPSPPEACGTSGTQKTTHRRPRSHGTPPATSSTPQPSRRGEANDEQLDSVAASVARDLAEIALREPRLASGALAASARALAREMDSSHNSATSKSMCAKALLDTLDRIRELVPADEEGDEVDELAERRRERLAGAARAAD